ncbi:ABC transporter transmembrane domain-containing protein [Singulisphaera rosea]
MVQRQDTPRNGFWREFRNIVERGLQVWKLVPWRQRFALAGAVVVMSTTSAAWTAIPLLLGALVNAVNEQSKQGLGEAAVMKTAVFYLTLIGVAYLVREGMNVLRRYLVESTCTRIDRDMCVRLLSHLMTVDLATLSRDQVGALQGRITRSVEGFVRFLRISFLDFFPAILTGTFALTAALSKQPKIALAMAGVIPISVALTMWQLLTQKGIRLGLLRTREEMDGTVVEQLGGIDYIRAANTHQAEIARVERTAERKRSKELRHHFEMSLFGCGKALNEGFFHLLVIAFAISLFIHGGIQNGDILLFSALFLNVMAPLNEIHRFIDEAHESSLRVGDLVEILSQPSDRSFQPTNPGVPTLGQDTPLFA